VLGSPHICEQTLNKIGGAEKCSEVRDHVPIEHQRLLLAKACDTDR
jgi:hypothetical protein